MHLEGCADDLLRKFTVRIRFTGVGGWSGRDNLRPICVHLSFNGRGGAANLCSICVHLWLLNPGWCGVPICALSAFICASIGGAEGPFRIRAAGSICAPSASICGSIRGAERLICVLSVSIC